MQWFYILVAYGFLFGGPYGTPGECAAALQTAIDARPPLGIGPNAELPSAQGLCFQGNSITDPRKPAHP